MRTGSTPNLRVASRLDKDAPRDGECSVSQTNNQNFSGSRSLPDEGRYVHLVRHQHQLAIRTFN